MFGGGGGGGLFGSSSSSSAATSGGNFSTGNVHQVGGHGNTATVTTKQTADMSADAKAKAEAVAAASPYGDGGDVGASAGGGFSLASVPKAVWFIAGGLVLLLVVMTFMGGEE